MINTVRIASCFEGEQERTLPILETVISGWRAVKRYDWRPCGYGVFAGFEREENFFET